MPILPDIESIAKMPTTVYWPYMIIGLVSVLNFLGSLIWSKKHDKQYGLIIRGLEDRIKHYESISSPEYQLYIKTQIADLGSAISNLKEKASLLEKEKEELETSLKKAESVTQANVEVRDNFFEQLNSKDKEIETLKKSIDYLTGATATIQNFSESYRVNRLTDEIKEPLRRLQIRLDSIKDEVNDKTSNK